MKRISSIILLMVLALMVGTGIFLATWNIPAPLKTVEKVIPDERFAR